MSPALPRVAIVGAGRAGMSFYENLWQKDYPLRHPWARAGTTPLAEAIADADVVLLTVPDRAVAELAALVAPLPHVDGAIVAHAAGALDLTPLRTAREAGWRTGSLHPLLSIATPSTSLQGSFAAVDGDDEAVRQVLSAIADRLGMQVLPEIADRARYHAAACVAGNYVQALLEAAVRILASTGVPRDEALRALMPLATSALENTAARGPAGGLTGPISRGDLETVERHLAALATMHDPSVERLYRAAGAVATELAETRGVAGSDAIRRRLEEDA